MRWVVVMVASLAVARAVPADQAALQALAVANVGAGQGVFVEADDGTVLASVLADRAVHPASVTKVATTLALLERLGPDHRFETRVGATGPLRDGRLAGDLVVHGGNDPFFVYESAFLLLRRLHALGVRRIQGRTRVDGTFLLNWQPDPTGSRLVRVLGGREGAQAWPAVAQGEALGATAIVFEGPAPGPPQPERVLAVYRSPPLLHVLKVCNGYSNNVLHFASDAIGGPHVVEAIARDAVPPAFRAEITIDNGAGAGKTNRISPRAAVAILRALDRHVRSIGHDLTELLPVSGVDPGTLEERFLDHRRYVVGKTGTFGSEGASALVGLLRSPRYGRVAFAVLNHGVPVPAARAKQDAFVRALIDAVGAKPWPYATPTRPTYTLAQVE